MAHDAGEDVRFSTKPPDVTAPGFKRRLGEKLSAMVMPLIRYAARPYLGGENVGDALAVANRLQREGFATALSYWDDGRDSADTIEVLANTALDAIAAGGNASYLSLKPPALHFSRDAARRLAHAAATHRLRLHFDSHGSETVDAQNAMLEAMQEALPANRLGTTLPGRLLRTPNDADWAAARGFCVRVVKGEWPDPANPRCDLAQSFLAVIDRLAGRAAHVAVATHDFALGREAVTRLRRAGTSVEIEVLLGLPARALLEWAKENGVIVRVYVPYGGGFVANAVGVLRRNPHLALTIARAALTPRIT